MKKSHAASHHRRGVLLLIVLSMLTLFLMLGASYLVVAIRARKVSKAYADRIVNASAVGANAARLVDEAFLVIARGTPNATVAYVGAGEDLLGDKYGSAAGTAIGGRIQSASAFNGSNAFIAIATSNLTPALPSGSVSELPGRVFTLTLPGLSVSARILRATGVAAAPTIVIPAGLTASGAPLSLAGVQAALTRASGLGGNHFRVNGREFSGDPAVATDTNEPYDAFDARNPLLTRIQPTAGGTVTPSAMNGPTASLTVDNDGDGQLDSRFLSLGLPRFIEKSGAVIEPRAAVLVVDLDGRINLNTHDSTTDADTTADPVTGRSMYPSFLSRTEIPGNGVDDDNNGTADDVLTWTAPPVPADAYTLQSLPRGSAAGVASTSVRKANVLPPVDGTRPAGKTNSRRVTVQAGGRPLGGITAAKNAALPNDAVATRPAPKIGGSEGRYGGSPATGNQPWDDANLAASALPRPGRGSARAGYAPTEAFNDPVNEDRERWDVALVNDLSAARPGNRIADNYFTNPGRYGSPPDLKDRMRVWVDPSTGQPVYYKPFWDENGSNPPTITDNEVVDDPYEINLTRSGSRLNAPRNPGTGGSKVDNPFTAADLEGLLRYFDPDSPRLSRRLVAIAGSDASQNRLKLTTESWDTPAVTDTAWERVVRTQFATLLAGATPHDFFAPETVAGHRLDLNRPFHDTDFNEPYFDDINGDGIWNPGPAPPPEPRTGELRRQLFAKQFYCLLVAIAARNGATLDAQAREQLAQYAVNIVDFRDADSIMTRFDYDATFAPGSTTWTTAAGDTVWGCERPELLITETHAWHDRRTDDESVGGSVRDGSDPSFDQKRRPQGAFFVELTAPWGAKALRYDPATNAVVPVTDSGGGPGAALRGDMLPSELLFSEDVNGNKMLDTGEDTDGDGALDSTPRRRAWSAVYLEKTVPHPIAASRSPVWRLVSVRGRYVNPATGSPDPTRDAFGTDPVLPATANPTQAIRDPARAGGPPIDRIFYFTPPPPALANEIPGGVFWTTTPGTTPLTPGNYRVVGTDLALSPSNNLSPEPPTPPKLAPTAPAPAHVQTFDSSPAKPATLTEPLISAASDPYDAVMQAIGTNPLVPATLNSEANWSNAINDPLDSYGPIARSFPGAANVTSAPFLDGSGNAILMQNGTHENFAVIHLQRLADPTRPHNSMAGSPQFNPYITIDCLPVDLAVTNHVNPKGTGDPKPGLLAFSTGNYDDPGGVGKNYRRSVDRGGNSAPPEESDRWSRRLQSEITNLDDAAAFRNPVSANRALLPLSDPNSNVVLPSPFHTLDGRVTSIRVTNGGSGYTAPVTIAINPIPGDLGTGATASALVTGGTVTEIIVTNGGSLYATAPSISITGGGGSGATAVAFIGGPPTRWLNAPAAWMPWPNRPFAQAMELATVPYTSPFHLTLRHSIDSSTVQSSQKFFHLPGYFEDSTPLAPWDAVTGRTTPAAPSVLDFVAIPSRFAGLYMTVPNAALNTPALTALGFNNHPISHISHYREPGRINLNTIADSSAWRAMFGAVDALGTISGTISVGGPADPDIDQDNPPPNLDRLPRWSPELFGPSGQQGGTVPGAAVSPALSLRDFFRNMPAPPPGTDPNQAPTRPTTARTGGFLDNATGAVNPHRDTARNAFFRYRTMSDLAERVTTRSNVFAVWVTVGYFDVTDPNAPVEVSPVVRNRGFYLFDRSIPVAYERGQDHNVRDAILLRRIIQ